MRPLELPAGMVLTYAIESIDPLTGARYHSIHLRVGDEVWVVNPDETEARFQAYLLGDKEFRPYPELMDVARDVVAHYWPDPAADMMALAEAEAGCCPTSEHADTCRSVEAIEERFNRSVDAEAARIEASL